MKAGFLKAILKRSGMLSVLWLLGCQQPDDEQQRAQWLRWISHQLNQIEQRLFEDIDRERQGILPTPGKPHYQSRGYIDYVLTEKDGRRLQIGEFDSLSLNHIKQTDSYQRLAAHVHAAGYRIRLTETLIDGDGDLQSMEIDEYDDEQERYFTIRISGW